MKTFALIFTLALGGCGHEAFKCVEKYSAPSKRVVGTYEHARCSPGEVVTASYLEYEPGGQPKWMVVECSKVELACE